MSCAHAFSGCTGLFGALSLPASLTNIGEQAFYNCTGLTGNISVPNGVKNIGASTFYNCSGITGITIGDGVETIADKAFYGCSGLVAITIPANVTSISDDVFAGCTALKTVRIEDGAETLSLGCCNYYSSKYGLFYNCPLETLYLGRNLSYDNSGYDSSPFYYRTELNSVTIGDKVTSIGYGAFCCCYSLKNVNIPESVTTIAETAFMSSGLMSISIPAGVTGIGDSAFGSCDDLKTVCNFSSLNISAGSTSHGYVAYYADKVVNAPGGGVVGDFVFKMTNGTAVLCEYIGNADKIPLPANYKGSNYSVGENVFKNNTNITRVVIPNGVTSIGNNAFYGCTNLHTVTNFSSLSISAGSTSHGYVAYYAYNVDENTNGEVVGNFIFETINAGFYNEKYQLVEYFEEETPVVQTFDDITFTYYDGDGIAGYYEYYITVEAGDALSLKWASEYFEDEYGCSIHSSLYIEITKEDDWDVIASGNILTNYSYAFPESGSYMIRFYNHGPGKVYDFKISEPLEVVLPNDYKGEKYSIGEQVFRNTKISAVIISDNVTGIGSYAFYGCSGLTSITIPNSVTSIGDYAFGGCYGLISIEIPNSVTSIGVGAFSGCSSLTAIEIPSSVTSIGGSAFYRTAWYNNQPDGMVYAGKVLYAYKGTMPENTSITIKEGTIEIAGNAFSGCSGLTAIEIPSSVTSIGYSAFEDCTGLTSIEIPNSVTSIGGSTFYGCSGLTSIEIPKSVTSIGYNTFRGCSGLTSVTIPNSVTSIGGCAFYNCTGLISIEIPNSVTSIDYAAFYGCSGLTSIEIPKTVTSIGYNTFRGCSGLKEIYSLAKTPPTIDSSTFNNYTATLYVPYGTKSAYQAANYWKNFTNIVEMEPESLPGDVNEDGRVSVADITTVVDAILNESSDAAYDVNGDSRVSVADITTIVDIILNEGASAASKAPARVATRSTSALSLYIDPFEINAGEEKDILVNLSNAGTEITAVEFDLFLPEGLEVVSDEYGYYLSPGSRTPNKRNPHSVSGDLLSSGAIHVICYHNGQLAFTGEDGDVVVITIKAAEDLEPGNYTIDLKNIELVNPADPTNGILISDSNTVVTDIENIEAEEEGTTVIYDLSGRRVTEPVKGGIYIINGKKVVVE